jgi:serine/threonine protein kinase
MLCNQQHSIRDVIRDINSVVIQINTCSASVKGNVAQCQRLAERARLVDEAVKPFLDVRNINPGQQSNYLAALQSICLTLQEILALLSKFSEEKSWIRSLFFDTKGQQIKLQNIGARLSSDLQQLNLLLVAKQVSDAKQDKEDRERDYQALVAQQAELATKAQETKNHMQQLAMDESKRQEMMSKQMDSFRFAIEQMQPGGQQIEDERERIVSELRIPFHQLSIDNLISESAFGSTYVGKYWEQEVAIKLIDRSLTESERREFLREVQIMYRLRSDFVLPIYAVCDEPDRTCIVTKHMAQGTLRQVLDNQPNLTPKQRHRLALDVALGLYYLHSQDILHRNLNSNTIWVDATNRACLAEFGLSKNTTGNVSTLEKCTEEMLQWMPPEVVMGTVDWHGYSSQSDVYSFGIVLWEILTGKIPFAGKSHAQLIRSLIDKKRETLSPELPAIYRELIQACWQEHPFDRPSLDKVIHDLQVYRVPELSASSQSSSSSSFWQTPVDADVFFTAGYQYEKQKEYNKAIRCYERAIYEEQHIKAKTHLGMLYLLGRGVPKNGLKAKSLLLEAARAGHARAMANLARLLETGDDGMAPDKEQARVWRELADYKSAADKGDEAAEEQYLLLISQSYSNEASRNIAKP